MTDEKKVATTEGPPIAAAPTANIKPAVLTRLDQLVEPGRTLFDYRRTNGDGSPPYQGQDWKLTDPTVFADAGWCERNAIILPALIEAVEEIVRQGNFSRSEDRILDIGCGPFVLGLPFLRKGYMVDGIDTSEHMIRVAREKVEKEANPNLILANLSAYERPEELPVNAYGMAWLHFVHNCCPNEGSLGKLFQQAHRVLRPGGTLVMIGNHPNYMHRPHSSYEIYDIRENEIPADGKIIRGRLFKADGTSGFELSGDYYWSLATVMKKAIESNLIPETLESIKDKDTTARQGSGGPAYFMMQLRKPHI